MLSLLLEWELSCSASLVSVLLSGSFSGAGWSWPPRWGSSSWSFSSLKARWSLEQCPVPSELPNWEATCLGCPPPAFALVASTTVATGDDGSCQRLSGCRCSGSPHLGKGIFENKVSKSSSEIWWCLHLCVPGQGSPKRSELTGTLHEFSRSHLEVEELGILATGNVERPRFTAGINVPKRHETSI